MKTKTKAKILLGAFIISGMYFQISTLSVIRAAGGNQTAVVAKSKKKATALHIAAYDGNLDKCKEIIKNLYSNKSKVIALNAQDTNRNTVLHAAILSGNFELVKWICEGFKIDLNIKNSDNQTPLELVRSEIKFNITQLTVHRSNSKEEQDYNGHEILKTSINLSNLQRMENMLENIINAIEIQKLVKPSSAPANPYIKIENVTIQDGIERFITKDTANIVIYDYPLLHWAACNSNDKLVKCLINNGVTLKKYDPVIIEYLVLNSDLEVFDKLLSTVPSSMIDSVKKDALMSACQTRSSHPRVLEKINYLLRQNKTNPNVVCEYFWGSRFHSGCHSPLSLAIESGHVERVRLLLDNGADVNTKVYNGFSLLHYSVLYANFEIAKLLIERGAFIDAVDDFGKTPLHWACSVRHCEPIAALLIEKGANPNVENEDGQTPLHIVAQREDKTLIDLLLKAGANPNAKDNRGRKPNLNWLQCTFAPYQIRRFFAHPIDQNDMG